MDLLPVTQTPQTPYAVVQSRFQAFTGSRGCRAEKSGNGVFRVVLRRDRQTEVQIPTAESRGQLRPLARATRRLAFEV